MKYNVFCIKEYFKNGRYYFSKNKIYTITQSTELQIHYTYDDKNELQMFTKEFIYKHFITLKQLRKLKLKQLRKQDKK